MEHACNTCAHFGRYMDSGRVYCVNVTRYIPKKVYTWAFNYPGWWSTDHMGRTTLHGCADYEKSRKPKQLRLDDGR